MTKKRNLLNVFILIPITLIVAVWVLRSSEHLAILWKVKKEKSMLLKEKKTLELENKRLKALIDEMMHNDYRRERIVRLKLGYMRSNEKIIKIEK